jgi:spermidine/putrescine transport system ATP-binding protein
MGERSYFMGNIAVELRHVSKRFDDFKAVDNVSLQIKDGEFFSLLGPSGCGKTTILRMIAGFEQPSQGHIFLEGQPVETLPPYKRSVNTVFQNYALFPHLTIAENIAFGLEMKKLDRAEISKRVKAALELVRLPDVADRKPRQLSGGQQQRIALARALINQPAVLLLDEPLSALDLKLRKAMQLELKQLQQQVGITFIFVTHDQEEAMTMSDRIAVMDQGRVLQVGAPAEIYERPTNRFVADFIGEANILPCQVTGRNNGLAMVRVGDTLEMRAECGPEVSVGQAGSLMIRPEKIKIEAGNPPQAGQATVFPGVIHEVIYLGTATRFEVKLKEDLVIQVQHQNMSAGDPGSQARRGETVYLSWQTSAARVLPA